MFDVIIVGGSFAGLSAALVLGRSRRRVLVVDHGQRRNAPSSSVHSFLSRDGTPPAELIRIAREQLRPYDGVTMQTGEVVDGQQTEHGFALILDDGKTIQAKKLLLATGVQDEFPAIDGLAELWGTSVFHCPYCHGWEVRDQRLAVYGNGELGIELAQLLRGWSHDLVLCTDGPATFSTAQRELLIRHGIGVREEKITRFEGANGVLHRIVFATGEPLPRHALFIRPLQRQRSPLAAKLGCTFVGQGPLSHLVKVDPLGQTGVPGLYVAGDAAALMQQAITAAANGAAAGAAINRELLQEEFN